MLLAQLALLQFVGSRVLYAAAWVGSAGFGFFIDEIGNLTSDNDYFFRPAVAIMYAVFRCSSCSWREW